MIVGTMQGKKNNIFKIIQEEEKSPTEVATHKPEQSEEVKQPGASFSSFPTIFRIFLFPC
jgi:hypothetical protein